jgi:hypothetical protein
MMSPPQTGQRQGERQRVKWPTALGFAGVVEGQLGDPRIPLLGQRAQVQRLTDLHPVKPSCRAYLMYSRTFCWAASRTMSA